ncbi:hypothetical protein [Holzapfeliella floricola]|uniref:hypothetical protein n=1 Tax=Holzapfeliella floricola TaxID=679249 RepID=UPI000785B2C5|nr:hypothetical protein [Holzapfeliella floricola]
MLTFGIGYLAAGSSAASSDSKTNESTAIAVVSTNEQTKETLRTLNQNFQPVNDIGEAKTELKDKKSSSLCRF